MKRDPAPYLRKKFSLLKPVKTARVYVCGLGYYELYLNGKKVGDHVLSPNQTNYDLRDLRKLLYPFDNKMSTRVLYETFDITEYLIRFFCLEKERADFIAKIVLQRIQCLSLQKYSLTLLMEVCKGLLGEYNIDYKKPIS